jgi:cysteinyl-tRNA synthetase
MSRQYLGQPFDIHCGGIDHIPVHHTNEIAQSEAAYGKPLANFWMHGEFLLISDGKMAKSEGNFITIQTLLDKGFSPLAYRYFLLQTHYRKQLTFSWEALEAAQTAYKRLKDTIAGWEETEDVIEEYEDKFTELINDDLNTPEVLALVWDVVKSKYDNASKRATILMLDKVLGLELEFAEKEEVEATPEIQKLLDERQKARDEKNWKESDRLRDEIKEMGFDVEDTKEGQKINHIN